MAQLNKTSFENLYGTSGTTFPDNTTGDISEGDMRTFGDDIADSFLNRTDDLIDDDTFATATASNVASAESTKAYVDASVGGGGNIQKAVIPISSAEILALNTTPKILIVAPGANKTLLIHRVIVNYTFVSAAYTTNTALTFRFGGDALITLSNLINQVASRAGHCAFLTNVVADTFNDAFEVTVNTGNPAAGDGTLNVVVYYSIEDL